MTTNFEDRIARLNAKAGVQSVELALETPHSHQEPQDELHAAPASRPILKYVFVGLLILVVMPVGAAMGTIYYAKNKDTIAGLTGGFSNISFGR